MDSLFFSSCIFCLLEDPMPANAQFFYGFTQFAIELNEPPAQDAVSSGRLPITDSRRRPDIRLLELGRVEEAEAENKRMEDEQRRRLRSYNSKELDLTTAWKPLWFTVFELNFEYELCKLIMIESVEEEGARRGKCIRALGKIRIRYASMGLHRACIV
ncbi:unnamed protein product [Rodentolepis nana]|uniref:Transmembrane protein n=1 Tax=Rodentolepis nana TaxID=102285 RepID=A0A0R3TXT6_RODNA|nr:unnamed protein product [Rodentolepis nana]